MIEFIKSLTVGEAVVLCGFGLFALALAIAALWGFGYLLVAYVLFCLHTPFVTVLGNTLLGAVLIGWLVALIGLLIVAMEDE